MEEQKSMIEGKKTSRMCKVLFSEKERLQFGEQVASAYQNMRQAHEEIDTVKKQYAGKIKGFETEIATALTRLNSGWEMRMIDCMEIRNYENMTKKVIRQDSFEVIEEVALTQDELQLAFPLPEPGPPSTEEEGLEEEGEADNEAEEISEAIGKAAE